MDEPGVCRISCDGGLIGGGQIVHTNEECNGIGPAQAAVGKLADQIEPEVARCELGNSLHSPLATGNGRQDYNESEISFEISKEAREPKKLETGKGITEGERASARFNARIAEYDHVHRSFTEGEAE